MKKKELADEIKKNKNKLKRFIMTAKISIAKIYSVDYKIMCAKYLTVTIHP